MVVLREPEASEKKPPRNLRGQRGYNRGMTTEMQKRVVEFANKVRADCPADNLLYQPTSADTWFYRMLIFADAVLADERAETEAKKQPATEPYSYEERSKRMFDLDVVEDL